MLRLPLKRIKKHEKDQLKALQSKIDSCVTHQKKYEKADTLWKGISKKGSRSKILFESLRKRLRSMCVGVEICNYCEQNLESDTEHIYPKKLFPERTFSWGNYLQVCKKCNTEYKADRFAVFIPIGSANAEEITLRRGVYEPAPTLDAAFIDPRNENPMDYLRLNLLYDSPAFCFLDPIYNEGTREYYKAKWTLDILNLNKDNALVENRRSALDDFLGLLSRYVNAKNSKNFTELADAIGDFPPIVNTKPFATEKKRILIDLRNKIKKHTHPTVWKEMIRQRSILPKTNNLFKQAPEALLW
jgi:hypothetical protein